MNDDDMTELIRLEYGRVVASVALILGSERDRAEDFVQDALLTLWSRRLAPDNPGACAASNRARSWRRGAGRESCALGRVASRERIVPSGEAGFGVALDRAIGGLSLRQRQVVVVLFYEYEPTVGEIARALGVGAGSVKTFLHRAQHALAVSMPIAVPVPAERMAAPVAEWDALQVAGPR